LNILKTLNNSNVSGNFSKFIFRWEFQCLKDWLLEEKFSDLLGYPMRLLKVNVENISESETWQAVYKNKKTKARNENSFLEEKNNPIVKI